jgi:hypothetical protein
VIRLEPRVVLDLLGWVGRAPKPEAELSSAVVEIQRERDDDKLRSWPFYLAYLISRFHVPVRLLALTFDQAVTRWAARRTYLSRLHGTAKRPLRARPEAILEEHGMGALEIIYSDGKAEGVALARPKASRSARRSRSSPSSVVAAFR